MKHLRNLVAAAMAASFAGGALATVPAEEAQQLGTTLTPCGAEKAGNKDGSIPEYTGGLPMDLKVPGYKPGTGKYPNPFPEDKPLFTITAQNMEQYADKLTEGQKELLRRYPTFKMHIYKTRRTINLPDHVEANCIKNATHAKLANNGLSIEGGIGGVPFPIPKNGNEVMWNHVLRYMCVTCSQHVRTYYVDANGNSVLASEQQNDLWHPWQEPGMTWEKLKDMGTLHWAVNANSFAPARQAGEGTVLRDHIDSASNPRRAYSYAPGQRRVRVAPDFDYDTPVIAQGGINNYDEIDGGFSGKQDRYDFKLIGKKEVFIPYNEYTYLFEAPQDKVVMPNHVNPEVTRWELHRVWVVEATLKPGFRNVVGKRRYYWDEDWGGGAYEGYDAAGKLSRATFQGVAQLWDVQIPWSRQYVAYDLSRGLYVMANRYADEKTRIFDINKPADPSRFTPEGLKAMMIR